METFVIEKNGTLLFRDLKISWQLGIGQRPNELVFIGPDDMAHFSGEATAGQRTCTWRGHREYGSAFTVKTVWKEIGDLWVGTIESADFDSSAAVEEIHFPRAEVPLAVSSAVLFAGNNQGRLYSHVKQSQPGIFLSAMYRSLQYSACLDDGFGYYFDHRDPHWHNKGSLFDIPPGKQHIVYHGIHYVPLEDASRRAYRVPYENGVSLFRGGWYESARIYREWGIRQRWHRPRHNPLRDIAMWVWNRGEINAVIPPVERLADDIGLPVALDWYWWHHNPYDTDYPDYWPPREGVAPFEKALQRLSRRGIFAQVYTNGLTWDMDGASWTEGGDESVMVNRDGTPHAIAFNRFNHHRLGYICGEGEKFQSKIRHQVKTLRDHGLAGIYLDQVGCCAYFNCYNPHHRHPPGGGCYHQIGYRRMLEHIRRDNPGLALSTEECNEAFLDLFDSAIVLDPSHERMGNNVHDVVPVFSAVYHGTMALFGNYTMPDGIPPFDPLWPARERWKDEKEWHRLFPDQFFVEMARTLVWGMQPTVCNLRPQHADDASFREQYDFIVRTARFYHNHRDFLFDGEMLAPGTLLSDMVSVRFMARTVFTKEGEYKVIERKLPAILHSRWQSPSGRRILVLANYSGEPRHCEIEPFSGKLAPRSYKAIELKAVD